MDLHGIFKTNGQSHHLINARENINAHCKKISTLNLEKFYSSSSCVMSKELALISQILTYILFN